MNYRRLALLASLLLSFVRADIFHVVLIGATGSLVRPHSFSLVSSPSHIYFYLSLDFPSRSFTSRIKKSIVFFRIEISLPKPKYVILPLA